MTTNVADIVRHRDALIRECDRLRQRLEEKGTQVQLSPVALDALRKEAVDRDLGLPQLASKLMETICVDGLFAAVIDE